MRICVRLTHSNGGRSDKIYDLSINRIGDICFGSSWTYNIKTSDGYTYRDAEVCFVHREPDLNREQGLKKIIAIRKSFVNCNYWLDTTIPDNIACISANSTYAVSDLQTCFASTSSSAEQAGTALKETIQRLAETINTLEAD